MSTCKCTFLYSHCLMGGCLNQRTVQNPHKQQYHWKDGDVQANDQLILNRLKRMSSQSQGVARRAGISEYLTQSTLTSSRFIPTWPRERVFSLQWSELIILTAQNGLFPPGQSPSGHLQGGLHKLGRFMQSWDNKHRCGQGKLCVQLTLPGAPAVDAWEGEP